LTCRGEPRSVLTRQGQRVHQQKSSMRRGPAPLPGLLLAVAQPLGSVATTAAAAPPVLFPISESLIGDGASAARAFSGERERRGSGPHQASSRRRVMSPPCTSHAVSATEGTYRG
jgi:hypothetical protein